MKNPEEVPVSEQDHIDTEEIVADREADLAEMRLQMMALFPPLD